jgi:hypothetical protein
MIQAKTQAMPERSRHIRARAFLSTPLDCPAELATSAARHTRAITIELGAHRTRVRRQEEFCR